MASIAGAGRETQTVASACSTRAVPATAGHFHGKGGSSGRRGLRVPPPGHGDSRTDPAPRAWSAWQPPRLRNGRRSREPATARRAAIFEPLGRAIAALLPTDAAAFARREPPPPPPFDPGQWVRNERITCAEFGKAVAHVTFAADATDHGRLEDCARRLYSQHVSWNLPAWIVGPVRGSRARGRGVADVLLAWPVRRPVVAMTGDQFDAMLDGLVDSHCHARS